MHVSDFGEAPARVYWEVTRSCALACRHCRAEATLHAEPRELDTRSGLRLIAQIAAGGPPAPHLILTGGDPLGRADLFELVVAARAAGLPVAVSPSGTPLLSDEAVDRLHAAGVEAISLSIDGSNAERHEALRGVAGCFARTISAARRARAIGLPFQVNTLVARETLDDLPTIEALVRSLDADRWSLFFLVTVGRGAVLESVSAEESEALLRRIAERSGAARPVITTTEAPHFRRVTIQHGRPREHGGCRGHAAGIRDGNGVMFIAHDGSISPSGFLPICVGNVKSENPLRVYREAPLFRALRDVDGFHGRCGVCEYRAICGGSRARAWAATGDPLAEDPLCPFLPAAPTHRRTDRAHR
jgi:radical SAM protein with 4Fe4S-binding SPASM domain